MRAIALLVLLAAATASGQTQTPTVLNRGTASTPPTAIPPTTQPARPGLPSLSGTPGASGLPTPQDSLITAEVRPAVVLSATDIATLQAQLSALGLFHGPLDGSQSGPLRASVRAFQESAGLPPTGVIDIPTLTLLQSLSATPTTSTTTTTAPAPAAPATTPTTSRPTAATNPAPQTPFPLTTVPPPSPTPPAGLFIQP